MNSLMICISHPIFFGW